MKTLIHVLSTLLAVAVAVALIEIAYPRGVVGLLGGWISTPAVAPGTTEDPAAPEPETPPAPPPPPVAYGPGAATELGYADRDFDRGDFDGAVANYTTSKALAGSADERSRAIRGLERSLLAWALVRGSPRVNGKPADLDAEYQRRLAAAESAPSEQAWVDLARWASGAGLRERLPHVVGQALELAQPGGALAAAALKTLPDAGSRRDALAGALASLGVASAPVAGGPVASGPSVPDPTSGIGGATSRTEKSGIGGAAERGIPFGAFTSATREKLREAVRLHREGKQSYEGAAPDNPHRVQNRDEAIAKLKAARDIYQAAQLEDENCKDLEERLKETMQMLAQLRKDAGFVR